MDRQVQTAQVLPVVRAADFLEDVWQTALNRLLSSLVALVM
jgi:hypothetical protein